MIALELDRIFEGRRVPSWLRRFEADPDGALEDLLLGGADLGHLGANEPSRVLLTWLEGLGHEEEFVEAVDAALARWIDRRWGQPVFDAALGSATLVAQAWIRAADLIAFEPRLREAARSLRSFMPAERRFLSALSEGPARDPEGRAWLAVARHQEGRSLLESWWNLCTLPPDVPWYQGGYGIHGLRGLPRERNHREFPVEVAEGLARLASALANRVEEGWLLTAAAENEFERIARQTEAAYPYPSDWLSFWRNTLQAKRIREERAESWVKDLHPKDLKKDLPARIGRQRWQEPDPAWPREAREIAARLERSDWDVLERAETLLKDQAGFAESTGDHYFVVRSACNFAGAVRRARPERALQWADLARRFDPWNAFAWTTKAASLLSLNRLPEALKTALEAVQRFPGDVVARNGLGEVLKAQGCFGESEAVYRETLRISSRDPFSWSGLAEVLKDQGRLEEALSLYREAQERFPENQVIRGGLENLLRGSSSKPAGFAENQTDTLLEPKPSSRQKADITDQEESFVWPSGEVAETETPYLTSQKRRLRAADLEILLQDVYLLRRWGAGSRSGDSPGALRDRARTLLSRLAEPAERDSLAAGSLGLLELDSGELDRALDLLRAAARRFPGSARVRYALGRAEREAAARRGRLDASNPQAAVLPWRHLRRLDERLQPLQALGEGRTWLVQKDGAFVAGQAQDCFGSLGQWIQSVLRGHQEARHEEDSSKFFHWWASEVQAHVFGREQVRRAEDISDLSRIEERVESNSIWLNRLEEDFVFRLDARLSFAAPR